MYWPFPSPCCQWDRYILPLFCIYSNSYYTVVASIFLISTASCKAICKVASVRTSDYSQPFWRKWHALLMPHVLIKYAHVPIWARVPGTLVYFIRGTCIGGAWSYTWVENMSETWDASGAHNWMWYYTHMGGGYSNYFTCMCVPVCYGWAVTADCIKQYDALCQHSPYQTVVMNSWQAKKTKKKK